MQIGESLESSQGEYLVRVATSADREKYVSQMIAMEQEQWNEHAEDPADIAEVYF